jgi:hypothetical protein
MKEEKKKRRSESLQLRSTVGAELAFQRRLLPALRAIYS